MKPVLFYLTAFLLAMSAVTGYAQESSSGIPAAPATGQPPATPSVPAVPVIPTVPAIPSVPSASKSLQLSGSLEADYGVLGNRSTSPIYQLQYSGAGLSDYASSYLLDFYLNGDYQNGPLGAHFKTYTQYAPDNSIDFNFFELYGDLSLSDTSFIQLGKKMYSWGKGYAFNPVGYVNPKKDPTNPGQAQAGTTSLAYEYSKSLNSTALQNVTADLIVIPSRNILANGVSEIANTDVAAKLYFLVLNTDIDLLGFYGKAVGQEAGIDFSRNIVSNLEIHGELSYFHDQPDFLISNGALQTDSVSGLSYLAGFRWLNALNITTIFEYYHNGAGMTEGQFADYLAFLSNATVSNSAGSVAAATNAMASHFGGTALMQDYLYLSLNWPAPFNLLDFTPSAFAIYNIADESFIVGVPLSYSPVTNFTVMLQPTFFFGSPASEFGSKPYWGKVDLQATFSF